MRYANKTAVFDGAAAVFVDCMGRALDEARPRALSVLLLLDRSR